MLASIATLVKFGVITAAAVSFSALPLMTLAVSVLALSLILIVVPVLANASGLAENSFYGQFFEPAVSKSSAAVKPLVDSCPVALKSLN